MQRSGIMCEEKPGGRDPVEGLRYGLAADTVHHPWHRPSNRIRLGDVTRSTDQGDVVAGGYQCRRHRDPMANGPPPERVVA